MHLPAPLTHQLEILNRPARHKVIAAGRRWGKTILGLIACVDGHGNSKQFVGAANGGNVWWVAPTYGISQIIWRELKRATRDVVEEKSEWERRIVLPGGGSVTVKSADNPDSLRGAGLDGLVYDETAFGQQEAWTESLRPALAEKQGWTIFISTPKGFNWFHNLFQMSGDSNEWARWQRPTADNPKVPAQEIEAARRELGSRIFAQEFMAEFISTSSSGVFKREWFKIVDAVPANLSLARFWDLAATEKGDWTAGVLMGHSMDGRYYVLDVRRTRTTPLGVENLIRQTAEVDGKGVPIWIEQEPGSSGVNTIDHYIRTVLAGFAVRGHRETGSKESRAAPVSAQAEAGNVSLLRGPWIGAFLDEIEAFPSGDYDDQIDALSGAFGHLISSTTGPLKIPDRPGRIIHPDDEPDEPDTDPMDSIRPNKPENF